MPPVMKPQYVRIVKLFEQLHGKYHLWELWQDAMFMIACAISNSTDLRFRDEREAQYMKTIGKYTREEAQIFPQIFAEIVSQLDADREQDFLGDLYMRLDLGSHWAGQFFTPYSICQAMAEISFHEITDRNEVKPISVMDCACGGGATLIAAIHAYEKSISKTGLNPQHYLCLYAQDVDPVTAMMCYIQISLLGYAGMVKVGDSLSDPLVLGENGSNIWYTPMWSSDVWAMRRAIGWVVEDAEQIRSI